MAEDAGSVAGWLLEKVDDRILASDVPEFDQRRLTRLLGEQGPLIADFDQLAWSAFSDSDPINDPDLVKKFKETAPYHLLEGSSASRQP